MDHFDDRNIARSNRSNDGKGVQSKPMPANRAMVVVGGIVYHLTMMKCPYCGCSLVGYRPIPKECPKCHKKFEE